jgi:acyl-CoA thioesterase YciA
MAHSTQSTVRLPEGKQPALRMATMPADTNALGNIFGGWIMSHVDLAAGIVAARRAQGRAVTIAVNSFEFKQPVFVGDVVSFYADVVKVGSTSITVLVDCFSERRVGGVMQVVKVTEAKLTFVAIDEAHRPRAVPPEAPDDE